MLVTDDALLGARDPVAVCRAAERGGVTSVQLRLKTASARELAAIARRLIESLRIPVLVNDRADVAIAVGAAGVHLGPEDIAPAAVRRIAPAGLVIGASVGGEGEISRGAAADYWGVGPLRATRTKADAGAALGAEGFGAIVTAAGGRPCIAIGGVIPDDIESVRAAGGAGVAVVSGILGTTDVESAARRYFERLS